MGDTEYPPLAEVRDHLRVKWYRSPIEPATLRALLMAGYARRALRCPA